MILTILLRVHPRNIYIKFGIIPQNGLREVEKVQNNDNDETNDMVIARVTRTY